MSEEQGSWVWEISVLGVNCNLSLCPFLVISDKKRTKRNAVQGGKVLQISANRLRYEIENLCRDFCNPLPLKEPLLLARLRRASGEVMLVIIVILIYEVFANDF